MGADKNKDTKGASPMSKPKPRGQPPQVHWTIAAFNLHQDRSLLYKKAKTVHTLAIYLRQAIDRGATVISIRRIHPPPETQPHRGSKPNE